MGRRLRARKRAGARSPGALGIELSLIHIYLRGRGKIILRRVVQILLRHGLLFCERRVFLKVELRAVLVGLDTGELRLRLS